MSRTALDTSVLVAALQSWHEDHERSLAAVAEALEDPPVVVPHHVLLETYSVLTLCRQEYPVYMPRLALSFGHTLVATGQAARGLALLAEADEISRQKRFIFSWALLLAQYARALLLTGDAAGSAAVARRAMKIAADAGESGNAGWARLAAGDAIMALGREDEGRALIDAATQIATPRGMAPLLGLCNTLLENARPTSS
jgi:hypothetical protein